jgi:hypothetical protein
LKAVVVGTGVASIFAIQKLVDKGVHPLIIGPNFKDTIASNSEDGAFKFKSNENLAGSTSKFPIYFEKNVTLPPFTYVKGGLAVDWGGSVLPISNNDLYNWPITIEDLSDFYKYVLSKTYLFAQNDNLESSFPLFTDESIVSDKFLSKSCKKLLGKLDSDYEVFYKNDAVYGKSRILSNDKYGSSVFNPVDMLSDLINAKNLTFMENYYLESYSEVDKKVKLSIVSEDGDKEEIWCDRLYLGAGAVNTTRIFLKSNFIFNKKIKLLSTENFFIPGMSFFRSKYENLISQPGIFISFLNKSISKKYIHCQVSSPNQILYKKAGMLAYKSWIVNKFISFLSSFIYIFQFNLNSDDSNFYYMSIDEKGILTTSFNEISDIKLNRSSAAKRIFQIMKKFNVWLILPFLMLGKESKSYYVGGTIPMKKEPSRLLECDIYGKPFNHKNTFILDSANFPDIPATTFAFTIMANSSRIVEMSFLDNNDHL